MSIFNITPLSLDSTFELLYVKNNEIIDAINQIAVVDVQAGVSQGLYESFRGGGVIILGVSTGTAIGFEPGGALTLRDTGETPKSRTSQNDKIVVLNASGDAEFVDSTNMLPSEINNDIVFTGDISFSGDLSFLSSGVLTFEAESAFRDKVLELATKFQDRLEFATASNPLPTAGITAYLYDNDSVSAFNNADPNTYIGVGKVQSATDTINSNFHITVQNFVFSEDQQFFREFTNQGATVGGRYSLLNTAGGTLGRGLISYLGFAATVGDQTLPIDADRAGLAVVTNDTFAYSGGTTGQKLFIWRYNGSSTASAWTSSESIEANSIRSFIGSNFSSRDDRVTFFPDSGNNFTLNLGGTVGAVDGLGLRYFGGTTNALSLGVLDSGVFTSALKLRDNLTFEAGTTGVALNFNADLLDGAQGATRGGTANTVPITDLDGKIHPSFIDGAEQVDEIITQTSHGFSRGHVVYQGSDGLYALASANDASDDAAEAVGVVSRVIDANTFVLTYFGIVAIGGFSMGLGWTTNGVTSGLAAGEVYFLDINEAGHITSGDPQSVGEAGQLRKVVAIGLSNQRALITHYVGTPVFALNQDTINADSLVPVGSIFNVGRENSPGSGWLKCDGKAYAAAAYPDLAAEIQGRFYLEANAINQSTPAFIIPGVTTGANSDELRGFTDGMKLRLEYTQTNGATNSINSNVQNAVIVDSGVRVNLVQSDGSAYSGNFAPSLDVSKIIEVYGRSTGGTGTSAIIVPDLRARGIIGTGDPDGNGPENNMRPGEITKPSGFDVSNPTDIKTNTIYQAPANKARQVSFFSDSAASNLTLYITNDEPNFTTATWSIVAIQGTGGTDQQARLSVTGIVPSNYHWIIRENTNPTAPGAVNPGSQPGITGSTTFIDFN